MRGCRSIGMLDFLGGGTYCNKKQKTASSTKQRAPHSLVRHLNNLRFPIQNPRLQHNHERQKRPRITDCQ